MSSALSPLPLSQALKGPPSLWAPPVQIPIPLGGPAFPPCTGLSPGLPPNLLSSSSGAPGPPASAGCWVQSPCPGFSYVLLWNCARQLSGPSLCGSRTNRPRPGPCLGLCGLATRCSLGSSWCRRGPDPLGTLLCVSALPHCHEAPAGCLGISAPWQQGQDSERRGARPLRRPGPGRATSPVSRWLEPIPRAVQTEDVACLCRDRWPVRGPSAGRPRAQGPGLAQGHFCTHRRCLSPSGRWAGGLPRANAPLFA